jgi:hypothetical protein
VRWIITHRAFPVETSFSYTRLMVRNDPGSELLAEGLMVICFANTHRSKVRLDRGAVMMSMESGINPPSAK